jgi:hypothetical protein
MIAAGRVFVKFFQRLAENSVPTFEGGQLLRSLAQLHEKTGDAGERRASAGVLAVARGDGDASEASTAGLSADRLEQHGPAGDGFAMTIGVGQANEQIPPVVFVSLPYENAFVLKIWFQPKVLRKKP